MILDRPAGLADPVRQWQSFKQNISVERLVPQTSWVPIQDVLGLIPMRIFSWVEPKTPIPCFNLNAPW